MESPQEEPLFGRWLRKRRRALDLTQKMLARRVGCSPATIRKLEADERHPSRHIARELAEALGVPEPERDAFIRFARAGWADRPPSGARPDLERPWLVGAPGPGVEPPMAATARVATGDDGASAADRAEVREDVPSAPRVLARDAELAHLDRELERVLAGESRIVLIAGEAGQGKTALMTAFAARAQQAHPDLLVAEGTCNAYTGRGDPFLPFRQILAQLTGEVHSGPHLDAGHRERATRLQRVMPRAAAALLGHGPHLLDSLLPARALRTRLERADVGLLSALPSAVPSALPPGLPFALSGAAMPTATAFQRMPERGQDALRAETVATLTAIADEAPLLLLLDDLHWLDDSSAELLLHLAHATAGHPLLVVGAFRPGDLQDSHLDSTPRHALDELARSHAATLDLDRADGRAFVEAWLDREANALDADFRDALLRQTGGHPLFTIELLRAMQERGDLVRDAKGRWSAANDLHWDELPNRIADALAARIGRLDGAARDILRVASVEGETFTAEVLAAALELDPRRVVGTLGTDLEQAHRLVAELDVSRGPVGFVTRYRFRHNLIQRFVYDGIPSSERAYLHESVANALDAVCGDEADPVALALHYTLAHAPERAAAYYRRAGDQARRAHAVDRAIEHYQAALTHWRDPDPLTRAALQLDLGECQRLRLQLDDARRNLTEARIAFESATDLRTASTAQLALAEISQTQHDFARASDEHQRGVAMLEPLGDSEELASALHGLAYYAGLRSDFAGSLPLMERSMAMAERVGADAVRALAMGSFGTGIARLFPARREEGLDLLERSFGLADEQGRPDIAFRVSYNLADLVNGNGRYQEAKRRYRACLAYARTHQFADGEYLSERALWLFAWAHGDWSYAFERLPLIRSLYEGTGPLEFDLWDLAPGLASHELDLGRAEQARDMLEQHRTALEDLPRPGERVPALGTLLRAAAGTGDRNQADRDAAAIADAVSPEPPLEYDILGAVLEAVRWLVREPSEAANAQVAACLHALERLGQHYASPEARAAHLEARALNGGNDAAGAGEEAVEATLWTQAAAQWQAGTFPLLEANARAAAARALRRAGRDADAAAELGRARTLLASLAEQVPGGELAVSFARATEAMLSEPG